MNTDEKAVKAQQNMNIFPLQASYSKSFGQNRMSTAKKNRDFYLKNKDGSQVKNGSSPIFTPIKGNKLFIAESVKKTSVNNQRLEEPDSELHSPQYEIVLKNDSPIHSEKKALFYSTAKQKDNNDLLITNEQNNKHDEKSISFNAFNEMIEFCKEMIEIRKWNNLEVPIAKIPYIPIKKQGCNCKNSQCLKLYCDCFRNNTLCKNCNCQGCYNLRDNLERQAAIQAVKLRNPNAFGFKLETNKQDSCRVQQDKEITGVAIGISRNCKCKNSGCVKKYCECYQHGVMCEDSCQCINCSNRRKDQSKLDNSRKISFGDEKLAKRESYDIKTELKEKLLHIRNMKLKMSLCKK